MSAFKQLDRLGECQTWTMPSRKRRRGRVASTEPTAGICDDFDDDADLEAEELVQSVRRKGHVGTDE